MPLNQSNLPYKVQQLELQLARKWYENIMRNAQPQVRYNQYPTACPMGCVTGRHGTCTHGYRSFAAIVQLP